MTLTDLENKLCLKKTEDWQLMDLKKSQEQSFYNYALENSEFCLAWIAIENKIVAKELSKQNFVRENPFVKGLNVYRPLLLIVTDGFVWHVSSIENPTFVKMDFNAVKLLLIHGLNDFIKYMIKNKYESERIEKVKSFILRINKAVNRKTDSNVRLETRFKPFDIDAACENIGSDADRVDPYNYKLMHEVSKMRNGILEKMLNAKVMETSALSNILHQLLFKTMNRRQLISLLHLKAEFIYVNAWYNEKDLLVMLCTKNLYHVKPKSTVAIDELFLIDTKGTLCSFSMDPNEPLDPGFFKLRRHLLMDHLKNKYHE